MCDMWCLVVESALGLGVCNLAITWSQVNTACTPELPYRLTVFRQTYCEMLTTFLSNTWKPRSQSSERQMYLCPYSACSASRWRKGNICCTLSSSFFQMCVSYTLFIIWRCQAIISPLHCGWWKVRHAKSRISLFVTLQLSYITDALYIQQSTQSGPVYPTCVHDYHCIV